MNCRNHRGKRIKRNQSAALREFPIVARGALDVPTGNMISTSLSGGFFRVPPSNDFSGQKISCRYRMFVYV